MNKFSILLFLFLLCLALPKICLAQEKKSEKSNLPKTEDAILPIKNVKITKEADKVTVTWDKVEGMANYKVFNITTGKTYSTGNVGGQTKAVIPISEIQGSTISILGYKPGSTRASGDAKVQTPIPAAIIASSGATGAAAVTSSSSSATTATDTEVGAKFPGETSDQTNLVDHIIAAYHWATIIGSLLAIYMIVFAGFKYMSSSGNPEALQDAKDTIIGALTGLAMIILMYFLVDLFGVKLTNP